LLHHLASSLDRFEIAPGARGMVMIVFAMPAYDMVFKVIKDEFPQPKDTTRAAVMAKYRLVFKHDRAGRLVDAQEFEHLKFERWRFSEALLNDLQNLAGQTVVVDENHVVVKHLYVERQVTPLNIYLREAEESAAQAAVVDYGQAIKDLAASGIFPGDLLLKNFGVTRHGRVVFYDYDELCLLSECNFRVMPASRTYEEEISAEPWFGVSANDIFPEEFERFLGLPGNLRETFLSTHANLFEPHFWQQQQARLNAGEVIHIFPYDERKRLLINQNSVL
jgi:isocitrate dehydrogenase kinase/phosphatase